MKFIYDAIRTGSGPKIAIRVVMAAQNGLNRPEGVFESVSCSFNERISLDW